MADELGLNSTEGALVVGVAPGSPAANAGLEQGDVIVRFGDQAVNSPSNLAGIVAASKVAQRAVLMLYRNGQRRYVSIIIGQEPPH